MIHGMKMYIPVALLGVALLFSCVELPEEGIEPDVDFPVVGSQPAAQGIVAGNNTFAFDLLRKVYINEKDKKKNIFISPLSVSIAFAMLNNGAAGETRDEIRQALGFGDIPVEEMNAYFRSTIDSMATADPSVSFSSANAIWIDKNFPVLQPFKEVNEAEYRAEVRNVTFADSDITAKLINDWCSAKTNGMIPKIVEAGQIPNWVMALGNAIYFKGEWTVIFPKKDTKDEAFNNQDGTKPRLPTMQIVESFNYGDFGRFKALELPYGNGKYAMQLILPSGKMTVGELVEELDGNTGSGLSLREVIVKLPRFKVDYERILNEDLQALGVESAFLPTADFSNLSTMSTFVSKVIQKTAIEVNEEGTKAAAATVVGMLFSSEPTPPAPFYVDRPFVFLIREKQTGAIAFIGIIRNL
jgi:serpin B